VLTSVSILPNDPAAQCKPCTTSLHQRPNRTSRIHVNCGAKRRLLQQLLGQHLLPCQQDQGVVAVRDFLLRLVACSAPVSKPRLFNQPRERDDPADGGRRRVNPSARSGCWVLRAPLSVIRHRRP
jgi:hypothetical protein